jgi:hypothetical protein
MFAWPAKWTVALKGGNQGAEHQVWSWPLYGRTGLLADDPSKSGGPDAVVVANHSLVLRPPALFKVTGKISVDTAPGRFIIILIR